MAWTDQDKMGIALLIVTAIVLLALGLGYYFGGTTGLKIVSVIGLILLGGGSVRSSYYRPTY